MCMFQVIIFNKCHTCSERRLVKPCWEAFAYKDYYLVPYYCSTHPEDIYLGVNRHCPYHRHLIRSEREHQRNYERQQSQKEAKRPNFSHDLGLMLLRRHVAAKRRQQEERMQQQQEQQQEQEDQQQKQELPRPRCYNVSIEDLFENDQ